MNGLPANIPWSTTGTFTLGLIAVMTIALLVFQLVIAIKKVFGRTPPMNEELDKRDKALRKMIFASENAMKERLRRLEDLYTEMQSDRIRKWEELKGEISEVSSGIAFIKGEIKGRNES